MEEFILKPIDELKKAMQNYVKEEITANDLKHIAAGFGIYLQRNKLFMVRVRITGGELSIEELSHIYDTLKEYEVPYIRLTTRQNIQFHDVKPENVNCIIDSLVCKGFIFRGGGGDTFRSISVSYDSGISQKSVFDVIPYAEKLTKMIYPIDKAFHLARKIKIAISSDARDAANARWQDIGFIAAKNVSGENGFEVYIGGGMGRKSIGAIKVFDFVTAGNLYRCAVAMIELFDKYGNRENRSKARIRFIRERFGDDAFIKLYKEFYNEAKVVDLSIDENYRSNMFKGNLPSAKVEFAEPNLRQWKDLFTEPTKWQNVLLTGIPVSSGNLKQNDIAFLLDMFKKYSIGFIRINKVHEICVLLDSNLLAKFYSEIKAYHDNDFTANSYCGHILSCVGNKVCPLGLINSQNYAVKIAEVLDESYNFTKNKNYRKIINSISVSGCGNSCGNSEAFNISVNGSKKKINGELKDSCRIKVKKDYMQNASCDYIIEILEDQIKEEFTKIFKNYKM